MFAPPPAENMPAIHVKKKKKFDWRGRSQPTPKFDAHPRKQRDEAEDGPRVIRCPSSFRVDFSEKAKGDCYGRENRKSNARAQRPLSVGVEIHHCVRRRGLFATKSERALSSCFPNSEGKH